jgi:hypothetical protein
MTAVRVFLPFGYSAVSNMENLQSGGVGATTLTNRGPAILSPTLHPDPSGPAEQRLDRRSPSLEDDRGVDRDFARHRYPRRDAAFDFAQFHQQLAYAAAVAYDCSKVYIETYY